MPYLTFKIRKTRFVDRYFIFSANTGIFPKWACRGSSAWSERSKISIFRKLLQITIKTVLRPFFPKFTFLKSKKLEIVDFVVKTAPDCCNINTFFCHKLALQDALQADFEGQESGFSRNSQKALQNQFKALCPRNFCFLNLKTRKISIFGAK